jgi:nicotinamide riboside transporter PnuC
MCINIATFYKIIMEINWAAELLDTMASMGGWFGRWLNAHKKRSCFIIWSVCTTYWAIRDFQIGLYSQAIFCLVSIAFNMYGYIKWNQKEKKQGSLSSQDQLAMEKNEI